MPRISSYNQAAPAELTDKLIGTEISADNATKNFTIGSLLALFNSTSVPFTMTSPGTEGQIAKDVDYLYICVEDNVWRRVALSTF